MTIFTCRQHRPHKRTHKHQIHLVNIILSRLDGGNIQFYMDLSIIWCRPLQTPHKDAYKFDIGLCYRRIAMDAHQMPPHSRAPKSFCFPLWPTSISITLSHLYCSSWSAHDGAFNMDKIFIVSRVLKMVILHWSTNMEIDHGHLQVSQYYCCCPRHCHFLLPLFCGATTSTENN